MYRHDSFSAIFVLVSKGVSVALTDGRAEDGFRGVFSRMGGGRGIANTLDCKQCWVALDAHGGPPSHQKKKKNMRVSIEAKVGTPILLQQSMACEGGIQQAR